VTVPATFSVYVWTPIQFTRFVTQSYVGLIVHAVFSNN